jgi:hypothetical protein
LNYEHLQQTIESFRRSGVFEAAEKLKDYGVLDMAESLERSGVLDTEKRMSYLHAHLEKSGLANISNRIAAAQQMRSLPQIQASQLESVTRLYDNVMSSIDPQALVQANNLAAQTLNALNLSGFPRMETLYAGRLDELIERATDWASALHTRELLLRTNEAMEAAVSGTENTEVFPSELPELPQFEWVFELDRESLMFLFRILFHLTAILSPALGVAVVLRDREVDIEDLSVILSGLNVLLAYVLLALNKTDD